MIYCFWLSISVFVCYPAKENDDVFNNKAKIRCRLEITFKPSPNRKNQGLNH